MATRHRSTAISVKGASTVASISISTRPRGSIAGRGSSTEAAHLVTSYGGSLSGEHGDGQARGSLLPIMFGDEIMEAFREFKSTWDPQGKMNPGKVIDAYPVDENLRWGTHYHPWDPATHFAFAEDRGSFAYAANRCVGTGKCRKHDCGHDVSELYGDARRAALDAGPGAAALRDAGGQPAGERVAGSSR